MKCGGAVSATEIPVDLKLCVFVIYSLFSVVEGHNCLCKPALTSCTVELDILFMQEFGRESLFQLQQLQLKAAG